MSGYRRDWQWQVRDRWLCRRCGIQPEWDISVATGTDGIRVAQATYAATFPTRRLLVAHYAAEHPGVSLPPEIASTPEPGP